MLPETPEVERAVAAFIDDEIGYDRTAPVELDESLLNGLIDSTDMVRLVVFLEERFGITIPDQEVLPENFESVRRIAELVVRRAAA